MKMFSKILVLVAFCCFCEIGLAQQRLAPWIKLSNGKDFQGWHVYGQDSVTNAWSVVDSAFVLEGSTDENKDSRKGGDLITDSSFENFDLSLEWKISKGGNSGIIFLIDDDPKKYGATYLTGLEMQVLDNIDAHDNKKENHLAGSLYDLIGTKDVSKPRPVGEWNSTVIKLYKGHLQLFLNGVKTTDVILWDDAWNKLVAGSKFIDMPDFGKYHKGHIALQDHGNGVSYRNIKLRKSL